MAIKLKRLGRDAITIGICPVALRVAVCGREQRPHTQQWEFVEHEAGVGRHGCQSLYGGPGLVDIRGTPTSKQRFDQNACRWTQIARGT